MTFREHMEAAGFDCYWDSILGTNGYKWRNERDEERARVFIPEPPESLWWTSLLRMKEYSDPEPDTPLGFYLQERFP